jgi:NADPH:quinone reductase-like Zn-dependent oxidoreductase
LVKVHAVGINSFDWKIRKGDLDIWSGLKFPKIPGLEAAGEIVKTGEEIQNFKTGDKVILVTGIKGGCSAEYYAAKEKQLYPIPDGISYNEAAASTISGLTALQAIRDIAYVNQETKILINGGSGGVGTAAIQIAKIFEGNVNTLCSAANMEFVKDLGADEVFDYTSTDILTKEMKYDAIFDTIGNLRFSDYKKILNKGGVFVTSNPDPAFFMGMAVNNLKSSKKMKVIVFNINPEDMKWLQVELESKRLKIPIDHVYPLIEIKQAQDYSESGHVKGKIVISLDI